MWNKKNIRTPYRNGCSDVLNGQQITPLPCSALNREIYFFTLEEYFRIIGGSMRG